MKFRQRKILLSVGLFCFGVVFFLHSKTPDDTDQLLETNHRDASAFLAPRSGALTHRAGPEQLQAGDKGQSRLFSNRGGTYKSDVGDKGGVSPSKASGKTGVPGGVVYVNQTAPSECPHLQRPDNVQETQTFQKVDGTSALLEFSAFLDEEQNKVRVVGLSVVHVSTTPYCLLWYRPHPHNTHPELRLVLGKTTRLPEHHGRKYSAHYIECPLPEDTSPTQPPPYAVSVTSRDCRQSRSVTGDVTPSNVLPILKAPEAPRHNFTVCVTALNYRYSRAYELVEMIELNRLLGADRFTFYVHSVGGNVAQVLRWYQARGVVELVDWPLPMQVDHWPPAKKQPEVHYFAQLASHNDCLNRHRGVSRYLVYQDLDEFIVPKKATTWQQLLNSLKTHGSGYTFRCVFFRKDWPPNRENFTGRVTADRYRSIVLSTDKREPNLFSFNQRSKFVVDPRLVQTVGIHNVWTYRGPGRRMVQVDPQLALLHHYRGWENPKDAGRAVRDTDMYRFKDRLLHTLQQRWEELPRVPLDIPLSQYGQV